MAQAQLDERARQHNTFFIDLHGEITVKIWKKGREGIFVKLMKPGTSQSLTLPLGVCKTLLDAHDILLLASNFISGLIGVSLKTCFPKKSQAPRMGNGIRSDKMVQVHQHY